MRPREWELGCSSQYGGELTTASAKTNTPALQANRDKTEVPDPLAVGDLISYKLNN